MHFNDLYDFSLHLKDLYDKEDNSEKKNILCRQAAARAYYSCFHLLRQYAIERLKFQPKPKSPSSHKDVIQHYKGKFQPNDYYLLEGFFEAAKEARENAEYYNEPILDLDQFLDDCFDAVEEIRQCKLFKPYLLQNRLVRRFSE